MLVLSEADQSQLRPEHVKYATFRVCSLSSYLFNTTIMPPQRTALGAIDGNRSRGKDISPYIRGKIVGMADSGSSVSEIQARHRVSRKAVRGQIDRMGIWIS